jgi:uncharacterized membrane protein YcjF (UPF0283 family)
MTTEENLQRDIKALADEPSIARKSRWSLQRVMVLVTSILVASFLIVFVLALLLAFVDGAYWARVVSIIRDTVLVLLSIMVILVIVSFAILVTQIARFVNLLDSESRPLFEKSSRALERITTTTEFSAKHTVEPIVQSSSFWAGMLRFLKEIFIIGRLFRS